MTTTDTNRAILRQVAADTQRSARSLSLSVIAEEQASILERAADLALAGLWRESRFVAEQGRAS